MTNIQWFKMLHFALTKYCKVYNILFEGHENLLEVMDEDSLQRTVDFVRTDPTYNTRRVGTRPSSNHDVLSEHEKLDLIYVSFEAMNLGRHGQIFCSDVKFSKWSSALAGFKKFKESVHHEDKRWQAVTRKEKLFDSDTKSLVSVRGNGNYNGHPG